MERIVKRLALSLALLTVLLITQVPIAYAQCLGDCNQEMGGPDDWDVGEAQYHGEMPTILGFDDAGLPIFADPEPPKEDNSMWLCYAPLIGAGLLFVYYSIQEIIEDRTRSTQ